MKEIEVNAEDEVKEMSNVGDATEARVTYGKRKKKKVIRKVHRTDIFRAYSNRKVDRQTLVRMLCRHALCVPQGDYTYHHTVMQDIHNFYKHGYLKV